MATITRFEEIEAWKHARQLTRRIYACTKIRGFAKDFGPKDQIRRAAVSTMSNIAEGFERDGKQEFIQHLSIAKGSCGEVRSQLYVREAATVSRMISGFMTYLKKSNVRGTKFKKAD